MARVELTEKQVEKLWSRIDKSGSGGCWLWRGYMTGGRTPGYSVGERSVSVRRLLWEMEHGKELDKGTFIAPRCCNDRCVNPAHMVISQMGRPVLMASASVDELISSNKTGNGKVLHFHRYSGDRFSVTEETYDQVIEFFRVLKRRSQDGQREGVARGSAGDV